MSITYYWIVGRRAILEKLNNQTYPDASAIIQIKGAPKEKQSSTSVVSICLAVAALSTVFRSSRWFAASVSRTHEGKMYMQNHQNSWQVQSIRSRATRYTYLHRPDRTGDRILTQRIVSSVHSWTMRGNKEAKDATRSTTMHFFRFRSVSTWVLKLGVGVCGWVWSGTYHLPTCAR